MYSDFKKVDCTTVLSDGQLLVRIANVVLRDGEEISRTYHRHVLEPGDNLTGEDPVVVEIAQAVWTPTVLVTWQEQTQTTNDISVV